MQGPARRPLPEVPEAGPELRVWAQRCRADATPGGRGGHGDVRGHVSAGEGKIIIQFRIGSRLPAALPPHFKKLILSYGPISMKFK